LSGVLIITAFVAILAGALMTELSTNFILSANLQSRVATEATVGSQMELAIDQLQRQPIYQGCPSPAPATLNGLTASGTYATCAPTVDLHTTRQWTTVAPTAPINVDGTFAGAFNEYLVGDSAGTLFRYQLGQSQPLWSVPIGGSVTGPPQAMPDGVTIAVPVTNPTAPASPGCGAENACVAVLAYPESQPECYLPANGPVNTRPAAGVKNPSVTFFGDSAGWLYAYSTAFGTCFPAGQFNLGAPVIAGPAVFAGPSPKGTLVDEVFLGLSQGNSSQLVQYEFSSSKKGSGFTFIGSWGLAPGRAVGGAFDSATLPARVAVTFASGKVQLLQVQSGSATSLATNQLPAGVGDAPAWCCGSSPVSIGVGSQNGALYVLNGALNVTGTYQLTTYPISGSPTADAGGDWFVGADDGSLYEVPAIQSTSSAMSFGSNALGPLRSSVQITACGFSICAFLGSAAGGVFMVQLDARLVVLSACIGPAPGTCSGANPRLWANLQVGSYSSPRTVHVQGWAYYSP